MLFYSISLNNFWVRSVIFWRRERISGVPGVIFWISLKNLRGTKWCYFFLKDERISRALMLLFVEIERILRARSVIFFLERGRILRSPCVIFWKS